MTIFKPSVLALALAACFSHSNIAFANPLGAQVINGSAQINNSGNTLTVTNTPGAIIHWQQFNIGANETTRFVQQSAQSAVLNRVIGADPSQIHGQLHSNGQVYLINPNGILFGPNAFVDVNKLVASTLNLSDADFLNQRLSFNGGGFGGLLNQGRITTPLGGSVYLIGSDVRNEGVITTPSGSVLLAAGNSVDLVDSAGPELTVTINATGNRAVNLGSISASGGRISMFGAIIDQQGVLSADSASVDAQGRIVLKASDSTAVAGSVSAVNAAGQGGDIRVLGDQVALTDTARVDASGSSAGGRVLIGGGERGGDPSVPNARSASMAAGAVVKADAIERGDGGRIVLYSTGLTDFKGELFARGGMQGGNGGNGGFVETSGASLRLGGRVDTSAVAGSVGQWLIDPRRLCIYAVSASECSSGEGLPNDPNRIYKLSATFSLQSDTSAPLDSLISVNDLALSSTMTNISMSAGELISILPAGGLWTLPTAAAGFVSFSAPIIYLNGTIADIGGTQQSASGSVGGGLQLFAGGPLGDIAELGLSQSIVLGETARLQSSNPNANLSLFAANFSFSNGAVIDLPRQPSGSVSADYSQVFLTADAQFITAQSPNSTLLTTTSIPGRFNNGGLTIKADTVALRTPHDVMRVGLPLVVDARQTRLAYDFSNTTLDTLRIGGAGCISTSTVACLSGDFAALVGGSMQVFEFSAFVFGQSTMTEMSSTFGISLDVAGNISSAAQTTSLFSNQHLTVSAALNHGSGNLSFAAAGDVLVNQPIVNNSGSIHLSASRSVQVNAAISAAKSLDISRVEGIPTSSPIVGDATPGIAINANLSANSILISANKLVPVTLFSDSSSSLVSMQAPSPALIRFAPGVTIRALGANEKTSVPDSSPIGPLDNFSVNSGIVVRLGENASFDNQAGAGVFILEGLSSGWIIAQFVPPTGSTQTSLPVSINLGGLQGTPQSIQQFTSAVCGTDIQCADQVGTSFQGYVFTLFANPQPMPVVDTTTGGGTAGGTSTGGTAPDLVSTAAPVSSVVMVNSDPCVLNPASCSPPQTAVGGALLGVAPLNPAGRLDAPTVSAPLNIAAELTLPRQPGLPTLTSAQAITGGLDAASAAAPGKGGKTQAVADAAQPAGAKASDAKAADAKAVDRKAADGEGAQAKGALVQLVSRLESVATDRRASSAQGAVLRKEAESTSAQARATREEAKQVEVQAKQVEVQARKTDSEARAQREEAQKAEGEVKKAEAQVKSARTPEEKATASRQLSAKREEAAAKQARAQAKEVEAEVKKAEVDIKRSEVEAKRAEADSMQDRAQSKALLADARDLRSAGGKVVAEKRAETKAVESEAKQAVADVKKAEAAAKRVETEVKKAQVEVRQAKAEAEKVAEKAADKAEKVAEKLAQAEKKLADVKAEAQQANERVEQKKADVQTKVETVKRKTDELRAVEGRRSEERKAEMAMMFGMMASARMGKAGMEEAMALRQELKTETFREALDLLDQRPNAVDLPACGGGAVVCIPAGSPALALPPVTQKPTVSFLPQIQRKVAIMIGVNEYSDQNIPSLDTALPDAQAVGEQLQDQFGYVVKTLPNASRADIILNLNKLAREVGPNDSVTVYYAGHGYLNEKTKTGYWIPSDGKAASADKWISNNDISKLLANIPAKQVLLVSDSCYSGSLTKEQLAGTGSISNPAGILARRSVTVLSSGGDEPVSDEGKNGHSVFAYNFMNALKSVDKIDSAGRVFQTVRAEVTKDAPQEPQYGGVLSANHQAGGEFLFEVRSFK